MKMFSQRGLDVSLSLLCFLSFSIPAIANQTTLEVENYLNCRKLQQTGKRIACPVPAVIKPCKDLQAKGRRIGCLGD